MEGPNALASSFTPLTFIPVAGVTYTFTVDYANTIHSSPADLDGVTLFRYRLGAALPEIYTPQLWSDRITPNSARLFWEALPGGYSFQKYQLFASTDGNYPADAKPIFEATQVAQTEYLASGLTPGTRYYYKLVVLYGLGEPVVNKTSDPALHNFKTARETYTVEFEGDTRASAGGNVTGARNIDAAHIARNTATIKTKNAAGETVIVPDTAFRLNLSNSQGNEGAQLSATLDDDTTSPYGSDPVAVTTDKEGKVFFSVLSSRRVGSATIAVQENTGTAEAPQWDDVRDHTLKFEKPESRRLFGIITFNQTAQGDQGWEFEPPTFQTPGAGAGQVIRCRIFLRFRKDATATSDTNYFARNGTPIPSLAPLDADGDGVLNATELTGVTVRGSATAPLVSTADGTEQVWLPVNGHKLRVKIRSVGTTGDDRMVPSVPRSPRVATFSNAAGQYAIGIANDGTVTYGPDRPDDNVDYFPATTKTIATPAGNIEGVAEFHILASYLVHRVNQITFSVEDVTVQ